MRRVLLECVVSPCWGTPLSAGPRRRLGAVLCGAAPGPPLGPEPRRLGDRARRSARPAGEAARGGPRGAASRGGGPAPMPGAGADPRAREPRLPALHGAHRAGRLRRGARGLRRRRRPPGAAAELGGHGGGASGRRAHARATRTCILTRTRTRTLLDVSACALTSSASRGSWWEITFSACA